MTVLPLLRSIPGLAAFAVGTAAWHGAALAAPSSQELAIERGTVERVLVESGELRAVRSRDLMAPGDWRSQPLVVWLCPEGTTVAEGDTLVRFDRSTILQQVLQAEAELQRRQAEFEAKRANQTQGTASAISNLRGAEFAAEQAELRLERLEFAAEVERQNARLELERARLLRNEATVKLESQAVLDSLELAQLHTGIVQARADLQRERDQIDRMVITAPIPGLVIHGEAGDDDRKVREGDELSPGTVVVRLPDLSELEVVASVHELDRAELAEGQAVRVGFDAYPDLRLDGRVVRVAELAGPAYRRSRIQRFEVRIEVDGSDPRLRPGMTARLEIVVEARHDVARVPRAGLASRNGVPVVTTLAGDVIDVKVGLRTPFWVELLEGPPVGTRLRSAENAPLDSFAAPVTRDEEAR